MTTRPHAEPDQSAQGSQGEHAPPGGPLEHPLLFVGGGNMAIAILSGAIAARVIMPSRVMVIEPDSRKHEALSLLGARVSADSAEGVAWLKASASGASGQVMLCVKPQALAQAAGDIQAVFDTSRVVVSILAGTPSALVRRALGDGARVVRAMPNLAASIAQGVTAICLGDGAREGDDEAARRLFQSVGPIVARLDESLFDAFTALAGSGPAYLFYLAQGMIEGGARAGLPHGLARDATIQTLLGAAMLLARSDQSPESLRSAVTSKGGTTEAAVGVLDQRATLEAIAEAIIAGAARGKELAAMARG